MTSDIAADCFAKIFAYRDAVKNLTQRYGKEAVDEKTGERLRVVLPRSVIYIAGWSMLILYVATVYYLLTGRIGIAKQMRGSEMMTYITYALVAISAVNIIGRLLWAPKYEKDQQEVWQELTTRIEDIDDRIEELNAPSPDGVENPYAKAYRGIEHDYNIEADDAEREARGILARVKYRTEQFLSYVTQVQQAWNSLVLFYLPMTENALNYVADKKGLDKETLEFDDDQFLAPLNALASTNMSEEEEFTGRVREFQDGLPVKLNLATDLRIREFNKARAEVEADVSQQFKTAQSTRVKVRRTNAAVQGGAK